MERCRHNVRGMSASQPSRPSSPRRSCGRNDKVRVPRRSPREPAAPKRGRTGRPGRHAAMRDNGVDKAVRALSATRQRPLGFRKRERRADGRSVPAFGASPLARQAMGAAASERTTAIPARLGQPSSREQCSWPPNCHPRSPGATSGNMRTAPSARTMSYRGRKFSEADP